MDDKIINSYTTAAFSELMASENNTDSYEAPPLSPATQHGVLLPVIMTPRLITAVDRLKKYGYGLYAMFSYANHSSVPNLTCSSKHEVQ